MECPRCQGAMRPVDVRGVELDLCPTCEGLWFDADELMAVLKGGTADVQQSEIAVSWDAEIEREERPAIEGGLTCPRCSQAMDRYRYAVLSNVIVDGCGAGHGVWLDDGELRKVFEYVEEAAKVDPVKEAGLKSALRRIEVEAKVKEEALIDSLVRLDNQPGPMRLLGYPLQLVYRVLYKMGL